MENYNRFHIILTVCTLLSVASCESQKRYASPPGYDLNKPVSYIMPMVLNEISGIAFNKGLHDTLYAEQDEEGKVFHFKLGDDRLQTTRFGKKGDFEDIAICRDYVIMLRSDGVLFSFPFSETHNSKAEHVKQFKGLLPAGEYEGLASIDSSGEIFVLCKHCSNEKTSKLGGGTIFKLTASGDLVNSANFELNIKEIEMITGIRKINFHPSALCKNPRTDEWYVLSSVNKMLVITDKNWKVKAVYPLNPSVFPQPEGMAFDQQQNLYISNEKNLKPSANVLAFAFHK
jgi:uncharacterized protein YjiK